MIVRTSRHLEVSQLEIGTSAFASCAVILYALNWHTPKGVGVPLTLWSFAGPSNLRKALSKMPVSTLSNEWWLWLMFEGEGKHTFIMDRSASIPNRYRLMLERESSPGAVTDRSIEDAEFFLLLLSSIVFGAIHFAALHSTFPSWAEKIIWCVSSGIYTGVIMFFYLAAMVLGKGG
jgi:hypothetical protein